MSGAYLLLALGLVVDARAADLLGRLAFQVDGLRVRRQHRVPFGDHRARGVLELLVDDETVRGGEPADRVDREGPGHHVLLADLGHQRLRLVVLPVLDRVVGHQQAVIDLGGGGVAHEEVGLIAGVAAALHPSVARRRSARAALGGGAAGLGRRLAGLELLLLFLLGLGRQVVVALALLGGALVDLQQVAADLHVFVEILVHVLAHAVDRQLAAGVVFRRLLNVEVRRGRQVDFDGRQLLALAVGQLNAARGEQRYCQRNSPVIYGRQSLHGQGLHRAMRATLNNTMIFVEQARPSRIVPVAVLGLALALAGLAGGCRAKKTPPPGGHPVTALDLAPLRPPPPPAESLPEPAAVQPPQRRGGTLRVHLDAEPANLLPLAESDAAAAAVTNGLIYETLLDCRDGSYRPGLAESWDVSNDGMRLV